MTTRWTWSDETVTAQSHVWVWAAGSVRRGVSGTSVSPLAMSDCGSEVGAVGRVHARSASVILGRIGLLTCVDAEG